MQGVKERLDAGLHALAAVAAGNPDFAAEHMDALKALVLPLLGSPIVGEGSAFTAVYALAKSLPRGLALNANAVACALRLVELSRQPGQHEHVPGFCAACECEALLVPPLNDEGICCDQGASVGAGFWSHREAACDLAVHLQSCILLSVPLLLAVQHLALNGSSCTHGREAALD